MAAPDETRAVAGHPRRRFSRSPRVVVAGGSVAALEACLTLRAFAAQRIRLTLLAPDPAFIYRPAGVPDPLATRRRRRLPLSRFATSTGTELRMGRLAAVDTAARQAVTAAGEILRYDALVVAVGAVPGLPVAGAVGVGDGAARLVHELRGGETAAAAFVAPPGPAWRLELYELALHAAVAARAGNTTLTVVTCEDEPLAILGTPAAAAVRHTLTAYGLRVITSAYARSLRAGRLRLAPGDTELAADRVVAAARLHGPDVRGLPRTAEGFLPVDRLGRVRGVDGVYAAGDCTDFPVKHASLAAQQAVAAASDIAANAGAQTERIPFKPVLRCMLPARLRWYVEAPISGGQGDATRLVPSPPWPPVTRFGSRFLSAYLATHDPAGGGNPRPRTSVEQVRRAFRRRESAPR